MECNVEKLSAGLGMTVDFRNQQLGEIYAQQRDGRSILY